MKVILSLVGLCLVGLFSFAVPAAAAIVCATHTHEGTATYPFEGADIFISFNKPSLTPIDCSDGTSFACEIYRCEVTGGSDYSCKEPPTGHCVEYKVEFCVDSDNGDRTLPTIREMTLLNVGPCLP